MDYEEIPDEALVQAVRKRLLDELSNRRETDRIVNNVYGGGVAGGGLMDRLGGETAPEADPRDMSYFVDILREDIKPGDSAEYTDPVTGERVTKQLMGGGWGKRVHRFAAPKKKVTE